MLQETIARYKRRQAAAQLACRYTKAVALVGLGQHALANIIPVLEQLRTPLRYICVRSLGTATLAARRFPQARIVATLDPILADPAVAALFVTSSPTSHFPLAASILQSGKALFIEKPPCQTLDQLHQLVRLRHTHGDLPVQVGLQRVHAPAVQLLRRHLVRHHPDHYLLRYCTGAYPEGDPLLDLYIHPLHLATHLFGPGMVRSLIRTHNGTILISLDHNGVVGTLELSTAYSWQQTVDQLTVATSGGTYHLQGTFELTFMPQSGTLGGIPLEKIRPRHPSLRTLYRHDTFSPTLANNSLAVSGFLGEITAFLDTIEHRPHTSLTTLESLVPLYRTIDYINRQP